MSATGCKPWAIILSTALLALSVILGFIYWQYASLRIRVAFASEQTHIFSEMRDKALQSDVTGAANCLQYVVDYYPPGTKQQSGSQLDGIVERERALAVRDILASLRSKTHNDLGTNAEPWIQKYAK